MTDAWDDVLGRAAKPVDCLAGLIQAQLRLIRATPAIPAILSSRELHVENDGLRKTFLAVMGRLHRTFADEVRRAQDTGASRRDLAADDVAFLLIGLVQELAVRWSVSGRVFALEAEGARLLSLQIGLLGAPSEASTDAEALV